MDAHIRVDIEDLMEKLKEMLEDNFSVVELTVIAGNYFDEYSLGLKAVDISEDDDNADYGELNCISDDF